MSNIDKTKIGEVVDATVTRGAGQEDNLTTAGVYTAKCYAADGSLKWSDTFHNLITNEGRANMLNVYLGNFAAGPIVMGLKGAGTASINDTQASHASWLELGSINAPTYSGTRKTPNFSSATIASPSVKTTSTAAVFTMTSSGTVTGAFINANGSAVIGDTSGILFSAGDFTAGSKTVTSGDTINVTYQLSAS